MKEFISNLIKRIINDCLPPLFVLFFFIGGLIGIWISTDIGAKLGLTGFALLVLWACCNSDM
jgi:hypothetical protein